MSTLLDSTSPEVTTKFTCSGGGFTGTPFASIANDTLAVYVPGARFLGLAEIVTGVPCALMLPPICPVSNHATLPLLVL